MTNTMEASRIRARDRAQSEIPEADYPRLSLIGSAHLINDLAGNMMTSLTPYFVVRGLMSTTVAGVVLLVYLFGSSILQPIFGYLSDRRGRRYFAVLGPLWIAIAAALFGWLQSVPAWLCLAAFGGIGTAAFHPQAAAMVNSLSRHRKGWAMSFFSLGGNIGFALGPVAAATLATVGLRWSALVLVPGLVLTLLLALYAPQPAEFSRESRAEELRRSIQTSRRPLSLVVGVIALRSGAQYGLIIFLPLYFHARGYPTQLGSIFAFVLTACGAVGGLWGGRLSDVHGRRPVVVLSLLCTAPLIVMALLLPPLFAWPVYSAAGVALVFSNSVTVVQGQELLPGSAGVASGLTLGFGFGLSGVIASLLSTFADHTGVVTAIFVTPVIVLVAAALAYFVPDLQRPNVASGAERVVAAEPGRGA